MFIVTWQGRPMREYSPSRLQAAERGRLFNTFAYKSATVWRTKRSAAKAMRTAIKAWAPCAGTPIGDEKLWAVQRLVPARRKAKAR
jgi:hypothetical protein